MQQPHAGPADPLQATPPAPSADPAAADDRHRGPAPHDDAAAPPPDLQTARLAALGFMMASVCHELSSPLSTVRSVVQLLRAEPWPSPELLRRSLDSLQANVDRLLEISRRLLDFSRPGDEPHAVFAVSQVLDEALAAARADVRFERIRFTVRHDPQARVLGHAGQLREVVSNLLLNAAQAMEGSGRIDVRTACTGQGGIVDVSVADGGPGVAPEVLPRLFEPFFTTRRAQGGTGLGLAISAQIAAEHGGRLWVEPRREGGGACFHLELPGAAR